MEGRRRRPPDLAPQCGAQHLGSRDTVPWVGSSGGTSALPAKSSSHSFSVARQLSGLLVHLARPLGPPGLTNRGHFPSYVNVGLPNLEPPPPRLSGSAPWVSGRGYSSSPSDFGHYLLVEAMGLVSGPLSPWPFPFYGSSLTREPEEVSVGPEMQVQVTSRHGPNPAQSYMLFSLDDFTFLIRQFM